jgi:hypothetical protein
MSFSHNNIFEDIPRNPNGSAMNTYQWQSSFFDPVWERNDIQQKIANPILHPSRRPQIVDWTEGYSCNVALTRGLWHNSAPGLKLAGSLAFTPINIPLMLMGIPIPKVEDESLQEEYAKIVEDHFEDFRSIHLQSHRDATSWIWPFWSSKLDRDVWEFIPDDSICDIIRDLETGEVVKIIIDEELQITVDYMVMANVRRKRTFTKEKIMVEWLGGTAPLSGYLRTMTYVNILGIMPIPFANNRDGNEVRGHSDYERILTDLKNYHDTDLASSQFLIKFKPKQIQSVSDPEIWLKNNGFTDMAELDVALNDFILNLYDKEKTEYLWPQGAHDAYEKKLNQIYWKLVQGSGIPELMWGTKVEGNLASADNQVDLAIKFIEDKQDQKIEPYKRLFQATARIRSMAKLSIIPDIPVTIEWNALDLIPERIKAQILGSFASAMSSLVTSAGISKEIMFNFYQRFYPELTPDSQDEFDKGLSDMAKHKAFSSMGYADMMDLNDWDNEDGMYEGPPIDEPPPEEVPPIPPEIVPEPIPTAKP